MNTIKKLSFLTIGVVLSLNLSQAQTLQNYVYQNLDYITAQSLPLKLRKGYQSNHYKNYIILGTTYALDTSTNSEDSLIRYISSNPSNFLWVIKDSKVSFLIDINKSRSNVDVCYNLTPTQSKLIGSIFNIQKFAKNNTILLGKTSSKSCYQDSVFYYIPKTSLSFKDSYLAFSNSDKIIAKIKNHETNTDQSLLKNLYMLVLKSTSYDYETLKQYGNGVAPTNLTPWLGSSVLLNQKVVCDGYVKAFYMLIKYFGIGNPIREIGKLQTPDAQSLGQTELLHSRIRIGNKYYDPTFDDLQDQNDNPIYFGVNQTCFIINHYKDGWPKLDNSKQRIDYIKQHYFELTDQCPQITIRAAMNDLTIKELVQFSLQVDDLAKTQDLLCQNFKICIDAKDKESFVQKLRSYSLSINKGDKTSTISFEDIKIVPQNPQRTFAPSPKVQTTYTYNLSLKEKFKIRLILNKYLKKHSDKADLIKQKLKQKINEYLQKKQLKPKTKAILEYILEVIEE